MAPFYSVFDDIEDVITEVSRIGDLRGTFPFAIDGAVVKVNDFLKGLNLAERQNSPNGQRLINTLLRKSPLYFLILK